MHFETVCVATFSSLTNIICVVDQVQLSNDKSRTFALKCLKKKHIVDTRQQEHVFSEKRIMMESRTQFIAK